MSIFLFTVSFYLQLPIYLQYSSIFNIHLLTAPIYLLYHSIYHIVSIYFIFSIHLSQEKFTYSIYLSKASICLYSIHLSTIFIHLYLRLLWIYNIYLISVNTSLHSVFNYLQFRINRYNIGYSIHLCIYIIIYLQYTFLHNVYRSKKQYPIPLYAGPGNLSTVCINNIHYCSTVYFVYPPSISMYLSLHLSVNLWICRCLPSGNDILYVSNVLLSLTYPTFLRILLTFCCIQININYYYISTPTVYSTLPAFNCNNIFSLIHVILYRVYDQWYIQHMY